MIRLSERKNKVNHEQDSRKTNRQRYDRIVLPIVERRRVNKGETIKQQVRKILCKKALGKSNAFTYFAYNGRI